MTRVVLGLDLSLTKTGLAVVDNQGLIMTTVIEPKKLVGHQRLEYVLGALTTTCRLRAPELVMVEGPAWNAKGNRFHQLAGLWWLVTHQLWVAGYPYAEVNPTVLKRYITGSPTAGKDDIIREITRRIPQFVGGNDEADALTLALMGADHQGYLPAFIPTARRTVLNGLAWPNLPSDT